VTANIVIEAELTEEQLRSLFVQERSTPVGVPSEESPPSEDDEYKARLRAQALALGEEYERVLGTGPENLLPAIGSWLGEFVPDVIREVIAETAAASIPSRSARFSFVKERLRVRRLNRARSFPRK
jgi:hypothetical protein